VDQDPILTNPYMLAAARAVQGMALPPVVVPVVATDAEQPDNEDADAD
jgi:hypothetical protein